MPLDLAFRIIDLECSSSFLTSSTPPDIHNACCWQTHSSFRNFWFFHPLPKSHHNLFIFSLPNPSSLIWHSGSQKTQTPAGFLVISAPPPVSLPAYDYRPANLLLNTPPASGCSPGRSHLASSLEMGLVFPHWIRCVHLTWVAKTGRTGNYLGSASCVN